MEILKIVNCVIGVTFSICYFYQFIYIPLVWILRAKKKNKEHEIKINNLAILICARNESSVIADLVNCLNEQTYPKDHYKVFVLADNCTDNTAEIARSLGATVYERFNKEKVGKGYALNALMSHLKEDYPEGFDGYVVFDADNILRKDYLYNLNKTFCEGYDIVTSYRNSKNYGDNWVSAGYALWYIRESRYLNHARHLLGVSGCISGTGFIFSRAIAEEIGGWSFYSLTEDIEFAAYNISKGRKIGFAEDAELYDEQPVKFTQSWRQRMRWSRGFLQVIRLYGKDLIKGIFKGSWSCFDISMNIMPAYFLTFVSAVSNVLLAVLGAIRAENPLPALISIGELLGSGYLLLILVGSIAMITEWKHIHASVPKKILSLFTFPIFMFTYIPISLCALFTKVSWKPIAHTRCASKIDAKEIANMTGAKK